MTRGAMGALLVAGLAVWAVRFLAVYGFTALACERGWSSGLVASFAVATAIVSIGVNVWVMVLGIRRTRGGSEEEASPFLGTVGAAGAALSTLAILLETIAVLIVSACG